MTTTLLAAAGLVTVAGALTNLLMLDVPPARPDPPGPHPLCGRAPDQSVERRYAVSARIRPFLVWIGRTEVGAARIGTVQAGGDRRLELLIGTDPERTPLRVNRWGYISEEACGDRIDLVGLMTESSEMTVDEAAAGVGKAGERRPLRAIRGTVTPSESRADVLQLALDEQVTYRDVEAVLTRLPASGVKRHTFIQPGTAPGFLHAVSLLMQESAAAFGRTGRPAAGLRRAYVYGDRTFDLTLRSATVEPAMTRGARTYPRPVEAAFEIRNRATRDTTSFRVTYAIDATGVAPLRVVYRPRWWLELDLALTDTTER